MAVKKRKMIASYLKVDGEFKFCGTGFSELNESPSAQTSSKRYINQSSATQTVTGYEAQHSFNTDLIESEDAIQFIRHIAEMRLTGVDTETEYCIVDLDNPGTTENTFYARKIGVAVAVDDFADNDGELAIEGNFLDQTDPIEGTFDTTARTFTEGFTGKTLEFDYTATGAVTAISVEGITYDDTNHKFVGIPANTTSFTFVDGETTKTATLGTSWTVV